MIVRLFLTSLAVLAQDKPPVFYSWHAFEAVLFDNGKSEVDALFHFRTRDRFSVFQMARGSIYGSRQFGKDWTATGGFFGQNLEAAEEWSPQLRVWGAISRRIQTGPATHSLRVQTDRLFRMNVPAYTRYRFGWEAEKRGRVRPYIGVEEFIEHAGRQRTRPRAGVRFAPSRAVDMDIGYIYDHLYLRNPGDRHILQTSFSFHRPSRD